MCPRLGPHGACTGGWVGNGMGGGHGLVEHGQGRWLPGASSPGGSWTRGSWPERLVAEGCLYGEWWLSGAMAVVLTTAAHPPEPCPTQAVPHG